MHNGLPDDMRVVAFKPADGKWLRMKTVWDACDAAGIDPPDDVEKFFGGEAPDDRGVEITQEALLASGAVVGWEEDMREGFEIDTTKLPPDATIVRVYMSY